MKDTVRDEVLPSGLHVKKGEKISWSNLMMNRNPNFWVKPEEVIPERWLNADGEVGVSHFTP